MIVEFQITSLQELLDYLPNVHASEYKAIAKDMSLAVADFEPYMTWNEDRYTRNCIVRTDKYELILLCWEAGQKTSIHCHGGEECWVYNVKGEIKESNFQMLANIPTKVDSEILKEGLVSYMNDDLGYHKLSNIAEGRSMSLHLYMNPIDNCTIWNKKLKKFIPVDLKYDTLEGKPV